jgi:hypothetical protein
MATKEEKRAAAAARRQASAEREVPVVKLTEKQRKKHLAELDAYKAKRAEERAQLKDKRAAFAAEHYVPGVPWDSPEGLARHPPPPGVATARGKKATSKRSR